MTDLFHDHPVPIGEMIAEAERELALRRRVYPRFVAAGKMPQDKADRAIRVMEAIIERLTYLESC